MRSEKTVIVRPAEKNELRAVTTLFQRILGQLSYYNSLAKRDEREKYSTRELILKQNADSHSVLVAVSSQNRIEGFLFSHFDDYTIWLDWLGVSPESRRKGIGRALINELCRTARIRKAHKIWCDCRTTNLPSIRLLREMKFRKIAEVKNHWYGQDFVLWERFV
jgi:ribosomal protein S18 acetylase RimI-like enzyme